MFGRKKKEEATQNQEVIQNHEEILENVKLNSSARYEVTRVLTDEEEQRLSLSPNKREREREMYGI